VISYELQYYKIVIVGFTRFRAFFNHYTDLDSWRSN